MYQIAPSDAKNQFNGWCPNLKTTRKLLIWWLVGVMPAFTAVSRINVPNVGNPEAAPSRGMVLAKGDVFNFSNYVYELFPRNYVWLVEHGSDRQPFHASNTVCPGEYGPHVKQGIWLKLAFLQGVKNRVLGST